MGALALISPGGVSLAFGASGGHKEVQGVRQVRGRLRVSRGVLKSRLSLTDASGRVYRVGGKYHQEFLRLNNHLLEIEGRVVLQGRTRLLEAQTYRLVEVEGRRAELGWLVGGGAGALSLQQRDREVPLSAKGAMLNQLRKRLGCKIWVVGTQVERRLRVDKFGWVNCTDKRPLRQPKKEKPR